MEEQTTLGPIWAGARIAVHRADDTDAPFVRHLHHIGRFAEIAPLGWPPALAEHFLDSQAGLRDAHYRASYPDADDWIVTKDKAPIGRLLLDRCARPWRLIDIALLPQEQGRGAGGALIGWLQRWSRRDRAGGIDLHVLQGNDRAESFYRRFGFADAGQDAAATHKRLIWRIN